MYEPLQRKDDKSRAVGNSVVQEKNNRNQGLEFVDNRPEAISQRKVLDLINGYSTSGHNNVENIRLEVGTATEVVQRERKEIEVKGITHLVSITRNGSLYNEGNWRENEGEQVEHGERAVIETNDQILSRRGPNQEDRNNRIEDQNGPPQYLWTGVRETERGECPMGRYIREDTFRGIESAVEVWVDEAANRETPKEIQQWLQETVGVNKSIAYLGPFLREYGGVYGPTETDAIRLLEDLDEFWAEGKEIEFQAWYRPGSFFGHLIMVDLRTGVAYQMKGGAKEMLAFRKKYPETSLDPRVPKGLVSGYLGEGSAAWEEYTGVTKNRYKVSGVPGVKKSKELTYRREPRVMAEQRERNRTKKGGKPHHSKILKCSVRMTQYEWQQLKVELAQHALFGQFYAFGEAGEFDKFATRCLTPLELFAKNRGITLTSKLAENMVQELADKLRIKTTL